MMTQDIKIEPPQQPAVKFDPAKLIEITRDNKGSNLELGIETLKKTAKTEFDLAEPQNAETASKVN